jgi:hypothetical protein
MIGRLSDIVEIPNDQPWTFTFRFFTGRTTGLPCDIETADLRLAARDGDAVVDLTTSPQLVISENEVAVSIDAEDMADLAAGTWDFELRVEDSTGEPHQVRGVLSVIGRLA